MKDSKKRKDDHIFLSLESCCESVIDDGFDSYCFEHNALPELDFSEIDTSVEFLNKVLGMPLIISSITGGGEHSYKINKILAQLAGKFNLGFAVGSQRSAIEDQRLRKSFIVRGYAPNALVFANLGAVQLNYGFGLDQCKVAIDMIQADALMLHLNPLQEVFQHEGNRNFSGLLKKIEYICSHLQVPIIVKEVGYGLSPSVARKLYEVGVKIVDVAGAGSVSWSSVESLRTESDVIRRAALSFKNWGNPTAHAIANIADEVSDLKIIGSGNITTGIKIAKALVLGADVCGNASLFLRRAMDSRKSCENFIKTLHFELKAAMFCVGAKNIRDLKKIKLKKR